jgi:hypothetical protein
MRAFVISTLLLILFNGCGGLGLSSLGEEKKEITLDKINLYLKKSLPKRMKASFGKMKITAISALPGDKKNSLDFMVYFNIVTFEIPEGLDGSVTMSSSLRFTPYNHLLYPKDINVTNLSFANQSLIEYVSNRAKTSIPKLAKAFLSSKDIYSLPTIKAKKLSKFETTPDGKLILYFK